VKGMMLSAGRGKGAVKEQPYMGEAGDVIRSWYASGMCCMLPTGSTAISCWNGRNGLPSSNFLCIGPSSRVWQVRSW